MTIAQERPTVVGAQTTARRPELMIGIVIGIVIGLLAGSLLFGPDDVVTVDGTALTERQTEMVAMIDDAFTAWQENDVDAVLSYFTDGGVFAGTDTTYRVSDGSLEGFVRFFSGASGMEAVGQKIVLDDTTVVSFHTLAGNTYTNVFRFTIAGDVLITRHDVLR